MPNKQFNENNCNEQVNNANQALDVTEDVLMEHILDNLENTPIGNVLNKITALPEIRQEKVLDMRTRISKGQYDLNHRLDAALDKVLEDIIN